MSRENSLIKMFNELEDENQYILLANAYDLLKQQEQAKDRSEKVTKGVTLLAALERLEKLKVIKQ